MIVGGGFAGTALAYHLLRARSSRLQVTIVEPGPELGRGIAYAARHASLRLNVPASRMSIDPNLPDDFIEFAGARETPHAFLSRQLYGRYVEHCLTRALAESPSAFEIVRGTVRELDPSREPSVRLEDGRTLRADRIVLATGLDARPSRCALPDDRRIVDAWDERSLERLPRAGRVLLLGSGLSALDVFALLEARGHQGEIVLLSRHGLLPRPHADRAKAFTLPPELGAPPSSLRALIAWLRAVFRAAEATGAPWQAALDAFRPYTQRVWQTLPARERTRFVRHVRPYWEVLRHRAPADVLERIEARRRRGELSIRAGRVVHCSAGSCALELGWRERGAGVTRRDAFAAIVRCLGPSSDIREASPLTAALIRSGRAKACSTRLGIVTGANGRVVDACGRPSEQLFALGQLCRAARWETTSVPDIVRDAVALAQLLSSQR